jgi:GNAT superfamily N-acetyltransferase
VPVDPVTISRAEPGDFGDFDAVWAIVNEYYDAVGVMVREDRPGFLASYFSPGSGVWLARREGSDMVGCIALRPLPAIAHSGEVKRLYVQPASRGQGIAGRLLAALHDYARSVGYQWLYLDSKDDLEDAKRFYETHGYIHCDRYNDNPQATIFMRTRL